jgi:hypothetical protein
MQKMQRIFCSNYLGPFDMTREICISLFSMYRAVIYDILNFKLNTKSYNVYRRIIFYFSMNFYIQC